MPRQKSNDEINTEELTAMIQGRIRRSVHSFGMESATHLGISLVQWIDYVLGEYVENNADAELTPRQRMRREYMLLRKSNEDKKVLRELVRVYEQDKDADRLERIKEYCDSLGVSLSWALQDATNNNETEEIYQEADAQVNHALDWARKYFKGKDTVPSASVMRDSQSAGINNGTLKEIKSLLNIHSKRGNGLGLSYSWLCADSPLLQDLILRNKRPEVFPSGGFEMPERA